MTTTNISRKETHKRGKHSFIIEKCLGFIWNKIIWGIVLSVFINLAAYSFITNNHKTYMTTEENIKKRLTNTITAAIGLDSVKKIEFYYKIKGYEYNERFGITSANYAFFPVDPALRIEDFKAVINKDQESDLDKIKISNDRGPYGYGIEIYDRNTNELVNNLYSLEITERDEVEIREIIKTESTSKLAKWFLDTFK
ncbi:hypothetical protein [Paenibacillus sp. FSL W7-1332]|uniref:hypothetical protein n=1 Tax=Paenibacillus sp. FSL W7-1332 TaxID=2921702 RepID=UPI0030D1CEF8